MGRATAHVSFAFPLLIASGALLPLHSTPATAGGEPVVLSERIGVEIDASERDAYRLFPDIEGFETASFFARDHGYTLEYVQRFATGSRTHQRKISEESFTHTKWHVAFTDEHEVLAREDTISTTEPDLLHRLVLRYAARSRYELATELAADLIATFPATPAGAWAAEAAPRLDAIAERHRALFWPRTLLDQRGRTDVIAFSGYYGLWLGIAIPVALEANDPQAYAAGLLLAPPASIGAAIYATRNTNITEGQATIVSLGGHLGTWQGLGWAGVSDADAHAVVGAGVLAGLAGIGLAIPISNAVGFSEGHAAVTNSAMHWGGWFGAVASMLTGRDDSEENSPLVDMLIGSDVGVLAAGITARNARLSEGRMRLGTGFGGGLVLLFEADSDETAFALLGAGSVAGLALGTHLTRSYDRGKDLAAGHDLDIAPMLTLVREGGSGAAVPAVAVRAAF
jgi:hypothetical protein